MTKYEYKIEFTSEVENIPEILTRITETIKTELLPYSNDIKPIVAVKPHDSTIYDNYQKMLRETSIKVKRVRK